jgi:hypothetical protein
MPINFSYSQAVEDLALESLDDMEMLEEFNEEIADELTTEPVEIPEDEIDGLSEEEKILLGELDEVTEEEVIFNELSQKEKDEIENERLEDIKESEETLRMAEEINFDDELEDDNDFEDDSDSQEFGEFIDSLDGNSLDDSDGQPVDTLAEKQQKHRDLLEELNEVKQKEIDALVEKKVLEKKSRYTPAQVHALKIQLKDIAASPLLLANIRKLTRIVGLEDDKVYVLTKDITVKAHAITDAGKFRYIVDNNGELKYKVYYNDISNIKNITNLYHTPHYFSRIKKVKKVSFNDKQFDYSIKFNLHGGLTLNQYTNQIIGGTENYAPMIRTELGFMTKLKFPLQIGLSGVYESITGNINSGGKFSTKILSFGPTIMKDHIYNNYDLIIQPRVSVFADLTEQQTDSDKVYKLSDTSLLIGVEKHTDYEMFGKFTLGYNFQRKWIKPKARSTGFDIGTDVRYDDSFSIYVGHRSDWIW